MPLALEDLRELQAPPLLSRRPYPHLIKYMGSKSKLMDFVLDGINRVYSGGPICDLFGGSASLAGAIGHQAPIHSNDIQSYSAVLARSYLTVWRAEESPTAQNIIEIACRIVEENKRRVGGTPDYSTPLSLAEFNEVEKSQRALINARFDHPWHLFYKIYSGTWWSAEQTLWIDAIRQVADSYRGDPSYDLIISALMYAMAYASQGTGHYAQYRDANTESSRDDIAIYRKKIISQLFAKKYDEVFAALATSEGCHNHKVTTLDFRQCLADFSGGTVYADPPYAFVHYSRFYHVLETLVLYDYPNIQEKNGLVVKGRYRQDRHQSPFCIRSQVKEAFLELFRGVQRTESNLVLSYSNTGMISLDELGDLAAQVFPRRSVEAVFTNYKHMTLGRQFERHRDVEECLLLIK